MRNRQEFSYTHVKQEGPIETAKSIVLTPSMVNPNSYDAIRRVLLDVGNQSGIKKYCSDGKREFLLLYCDGVPYNLIWRVCQSTVRCSTCGELLHGKSETKKYAHNTFQKEFDWVVVLPGGGHVEMNMLKPWWNFCGTSFGKT